MLCVQTREIAAKPVPTSGFYFYSPAAVGQPLALAGPGDAPAWSYSGNPALGKAGAAWYLVSKHAAVDDPLQRRGTGLVAFASFGFSPETKPVFEVPRFVFGQDSLGAWLTVAYQAAAPDPGLAEAIRKEALAWQEDKSLVNAGRIEVNAPEYLGREAYEQNVAEAVGAIRKGYAQKIVLARRVTFPLRNSRQPGETAARMLAKLAQNYPSCWLFSVGGLVGATPEMLLEAQSSTAHGRVLAGTASPGENLDLLHSKKNLHEHEVAVASVIRPLEETVAGIKTRGPYLLELPNLQHLATDVTLEIPEDKTLLYLLDAIHPTAAVGGLPRDAAVKFIQSHEPSRERYAGPVGWVDGRGGGQLALALRCAQVGESGLTAWVGAGIMADSDPKTEFAETEAKLAPIRDCLHGWQKS